VAVAGVINVRVARCCGSFPIPFVASSHDPGGISIRLSGTGWTVTRTLQQLGTEVTFATYVGADELGQVATLGLLRAGLYGPATLACDSQPRAMVLYDRDGGRAGTTDLRSTPDLEYPADTFRTAIDAGPPVAMAVLSNIGFTRSLIPVVADRGIPIATDLHLVEWVDNRYNRDWLRAAHVLACSHEQLRGSPTAWIRAVWQTFGTEIVLVGCGADGVLLGIRRGRRIWHIPAVAPRGIRYTSGAGDTLLASFVHHYVTGGNPVDAARNAVLCAGWKVGGIPDEEPGITRTRLESLRRTHGLPMGVRRR
jgi:sugar/nucleoside kinase (ribokinase family)